MKMCEKFFRKCFVFELSLRTAAHHSSSCSFRFRGRKFGK
jgi:hypothetical protein